MAEEVIFPEGLAECIGPFDTLDEAKQYAQTCYIDNGVTEDRITYEPRDDGKFDIVVDREEERKATAAAGTGIGVILIIIVIGMIILSGRS